jgi:hypothetical protein
MLMTEANVTTGATSDLHEEDYFVKYMCSGFDQIEGWPGDKRSVQFNVIFRELFSQFDERGGVCEIGVHHGKYLIALHNLFTNRRSLGIDLFNRQVMNIDNSGNGNLEICKNNIAKYTKYPELITLKCENSISITTNDIIDIVNTFGKFGLFSIDGGHTKSHIIIDLDNAAEMTSETGVIIVDDIFHPYWPEVTEGLYYSVNNCRTPFVPFLMTRKKLYLCNASVQKIYAEFALERNEGYHASKMVNFAGWGLPCINMGNVF